MRTLFVIFALALSGCWWEFGALTPKERGIKLRPCAEYEDCEYESDYYKVYNQDKAMFLFQTMVEDKFAESFGDLFQEVDVRWVSTRCPYSDEPAVVYEDVCYHGIMWSCDELYVAVPDTERTCGSALLHEYAHCLSHQMTFSFDGQHLGPIWDVVAEASQIACEREW